ncbi:MAG: RHS repeat-associated core domain-containing protein [Verrucomicrobiaceae bacterium]|nr:RHS repeat-associated core domain-containing protein [Verrucomicrobiaceae bacterium]
MKYVYDAYGQMTEMHTYPNKADFASGPALPAAFGAAGRKTTWAYDPGSGALTGKKYGADALGTEYGYHPSGLLASRQWVRTSTAAAGQRVKTTYTYQTNGSGRLAGITYNDGNDGTTGVSYTGYSPEGYVTGMTDAAGTHVMSAGMSPLGEYSDAITGGLLGGVQVSRGTDQSGASVPPPSRLVARMNNTQLTATDTFLGTSWGRIESVRPGTLAYNAMTYRHLFSYGYRASSGQLELVTSVDLQNQYAYANGTQSRGTGYRSLKRAWAYNSNTARPTSLRWYKEETRTGAASTLTTAVGWNYPEYDELGRKKRVDAYEAKTQGLPGWSYEYDKAGEVTGATRFNVLTSGADSAIASQRRDYDYDGVGNRNTASQGTGAALRTVSYQSNEHNQYANDGSTPAVLHPRYVEITGQAAIGAVVQVKVNGEIGIPISGSNTDGWGTGEPGSYRREVPVAGTDAQWLDVEISASVGGGTPVVKRGWLYAPPLNETQVHDADGNLIEDARWTYEWDAENQLKAQEEKALTYYTGAGAASPPVRKRLEFTHDARHRRIQKVVKSFSSATQTFATISDTRFVWDGWNMIAELDALNSMRAIRTYIWGPDLSGTLQGAGGVGGLLALTHQGTTYQVCSDANGNVSALCQISSGKVVARYDYDPFGNRITDTGPGVEICPFAFSTKYRDEETGHVYFGRRHLRTIDGRWLNLDPIAERGGLNLYGMVHNDPVNRWDMLGLKCCLANGPKYKMDSGFDLDTKGNVTGHSNSVGFSFTASFKDGGGCKCCDCEVRQYIKWTSTADPGDYGFPSWPASENLPADTWQEDRIGGNQSNYGHRDNFDKTSDPLNTDANRYYQPGEITSDKNGCAYYGHDRPTVPSGLKGTWTFLVKVIDTKSKATVGSDTIRITWK